MNVLMTLVNGETLLINLQNNNLNNIESLDEIVSLTNDTFNKVFVATDGTRFVAKAILHYKGDKNE